MKRHESNEPFKVWVWVALAVLLVMLIGGANPTLGSDLDRQLSDAADKGDVKRVQELLEQGANPEAKLFPAKITALYRAAFEGHIDVVKLLLCYGADVNTTSIQGYTPLHNAAAECDLKMVNLLLCNGAIVDKIMGTTITPLILAASDHCLTGTEPNHPTMHRMIRNCKIMQDDVIKLLLSYGANNNPVCYEGLSTTLQQAFRDDLKQFKEKKVYDQCRTEHAKRMLALLESHGSNASKPECPDIECEKKCKLIAEAKHPIIPAHPKYYNQLTVKLECPEDQEKAEHEVKMETHFRNGHLVQNKGSSNPDRNLELKLAPDESKDVFYHWVGDTNLLKPQPEIITVRVPSMKLEKQINFTVGVDYKIDKIQPMAGEDGLCPAKEEPFIVNVKDEFNSDSDLAALSKDFNIKPTFKLDAEGDVDDPFKFTDISSGFLSPILQTIYKKLVAEGKLHDPHKIHDECGGANQCYSIKGGKGKAWLKCDSRSPGYPFIEFYMKGKHKFLARIDHETDSNPFNNEYDLEAQINEYSYPALNIFFNAFVPWLENLVNPLSEKFIVSFVGCCQETIGGASSLSGSSGGWESIRIVAKGATSCLIGVVGSKEFIEQYGKLPLINAIWSTGTFMMSIGDAYSTPCTVQTRKAMGRPAGGPVKAVDRMKAFTVTQSVLESLDDTRLIYIENQGVSALKVISSKVGNLKEAPKQTLTDKEIARNPKKYDILTSKYRIMQGKNMTMIPAQKGDRLQLKLQGKGEGGRIVIVTKESIKYKDFPAHEWGWFVEIKQDGSTKVQGADRSGFKTYE